MAGRGTCARVCFICGDARDVVEGVDQGWVGTKQCVKMGLCWNGAQVIAEIIEIMHTSTMIHDTVSGVMLWKDQLEL